MKLTEIAVERIRAVIKGIDKVTAGTCIKNLRTASKFYKVLSGRGAVSIT